MQFYFADEPDAKKFGGQKQATILTTLQRNIKTTLLKFPTFHIQSLQSIEDLEQIRQLSLNRKCWKLITRAVTDSVQANRLAKH